MGALMTVVCALLALFRDKTPVEISGVSGCKDNYNHKNGGNYLRSVYGDTVTIFCSGSEATDLTIGTAAATHPAVVVNGTTVKLTLEKLQIGKYYYYCIDVGTPCVAQMIVDVRPTVSVISTKLKDVLQKQIQRRLFFYVPVTVDYLIQCTGNPVSALRISLNGKDLETYVVDNTTIKTKRLHDTRSTYHKYVCIQRGAYLDTVIVDRGAQSTANVYVDYPPKATDFWCIEFVQQIKCKWRVLSIDTRFTLLYTNELGNSMHLCDDHSAKKNRFCKWNFVHVWQHGFNPTNEYSLSLVMKGCNLIFCVNQTFHINRYSIIKPERPLDLEVLREHTTSHRAVVAWRVSPRSHYSNEPMEYKVTYKLTGVKPQELNASSLRGNCTKDFKCVRELELPCSDTLYELKVYVKLEATPQTNDAYWSDPASITFYTDTNGADANDPVDPVCNIEADLINNGERALYEVEKLARHYRRAGAAIHRKVDALKQKHAKLNAVSLTEL